MLPNIHPKQHFAFTLGCTSCASLPAWLWENGERMRKWREIRSLYFIIFSFFFSLSFHFHYIKNCLTLSQNVNYGTFVANVKKNLTYALCENYSGSNSLWESFASCNIGSNIVYAPPLSPNHWLLISYLTLSGDQEVILVPLIWTTGHVKDKWWTSVYIKSSQQRRAESNWGSKKDKLRFPKTKAEFEFQFCKQPLVDWFLFCSRYIII